MKRRELAAGVAKDLWAAERAIDEALCLTAALVGRLPRYRLDANISAVVGQGAFDRAAETMTMLTQARRQIVETHHELQRTQVQLGIPASAVGGDADKPNPQTTTGGLRVVTPAQAA